MRVLAVGDPVAFTMIRPGAPAALESQWNLSVWDEGTLGCGFVRADEQLLEGKWTAQRGVLQRLARPLAIVRGRDSSPTSS